MESDAFLLSSNDVPEACRRGCFSELLWSMRRNHSRAFVISCPICTVTKCWTYSVHSTIHSGFLPTCVNIKQPLRPLAFCSFFSYKHKFLDFSLAVQLQALLRSSTIHPLRGKHTPSNQRPTPSYRDILRLPNPSLRHPSCSKALSSPSSHSPWPSALSLLQSQCRWLRYLRVSRGELARCRSFK